MLFQMLFQAISYVFSDVLRCAPIAAVEAKDPRPASSTHESHCTIR